MKFSVYYSLEKDITNYLRSLWHFKYHRHGRKNFQQKLLDYYPATFQTKLKKAITQDQAETVIKNFLKQKPIAFHQKTKQVVKNTQTLLNKNSSKIISSLEKIYQRPFPFKSIKVYITTAPIFPYNYQKRWFMAGRNSQPQKHIAVAKHELNHFMFHHYFEDKIKFEKEKVEQLKEALAVLTNPEGQHKPNIKLLEKFISKHTDKPVAEIVNLIIKTKRL